MRKLWYILGWWWCFVFGSSYQMVRITVISGTSEIKKDKNKKGLKYVLLTLL